MPTEPIKCQNLLTSEVAINNSIKSAIAGSPVEITKPFIKVSTLPPGTNFTLSPLEYYAALGKVAEVITICLLHINDVPNVYFQQALAAACTFNQLGLVRSLLKLELADSPQILFAALEQAVKDKNSDLAAVLLECNQVKSLAARDPEHLSNHSKSTNYLLECARKNEDKSMIELLLRIPVVKKYDTPIIRALSRFNLELENLIKNALHDNKAIVRKKYPVLFNVYERNRGLCDLMCNYFTLKSVGRHEDVHLSQLVESKASFGLEKLNLLSRTHILSVVTFFELFRYVFTGHIPNNIFSSTEQKKIRKGTNQFNAELLSAKLESLPPQSYIKMMMYDRDFLGLPGMGHSMLICKQGENEYLFFNPSDSEPQCDVLTKDELIANLNQLNCPFKNVAFVDNKKFMQRIEEQLVAQLDAPPKPGSEPVTVAVNHALTKEAISTLRDTWGHTPSGTSSTANK